MTAEAKKILCSVSIITRKGEGIRDVLERLRDFAEVVICHGNAPKEALEVAQTFGARLVKQYDTDEPAVSSVMDKAAVRQRAMDASTLPWRFFMDRDDTLSKETVEEIRAITTDPKPTNLAWRMPTRIFIAGREVKHEATYPSYQTRLVHESVGAYFRGAVHERLVFDEKKFSVGTMHNFYDFRWSQERVRNYWEYLRTYAERELQVAQYGSFGSFLYWSIYRRTRTIVGYILWRLPAMYLRWGFTDSMPLGVELTIVRYHLYILFGDIQKYVTTRRWCTLLIETLRDKDLNRTLGNIAARRWEAYGRVLDVGGDGHSSYWRFLRAVRWHRVVTLDISPAARPEVLIDLERDEIPFAKGYFDTAFACNVLEHVHAREQVLQKIYHALRPGGRLFGVVPFLVGVHPDPHDYVRLSGESLRSLFLDAGFSEISISTVGGGPIVASYAQSEFLLPRVIKLFVLPLVLGLDALVLSIRPGLREKFPLSYTFEAVR